MKPRFALVVEGLQSLPSIERTQRFQQISRYTGLPAPRGTSRPSPGGRTLFVTLHSKEVFGRRTFPPPHTRRAMGSDLEAAAEAAICGSIIRQHCARIRLCEGTQRATWRSQGQWEWVWWARVQASSPPSGPCGTSLHSQRPFSLRFAAASYGSTAREYDCALCASSSPTPFHIGRQALRGP
jgi:hypothetical protein